MSLVWTPEKPPPERCEISDLSAEAQLIWEALVDKHNRRQEARESRLRALGLVYYI